MKMDELTRRDFITNAAKSCLGVSAILGAQDLLGVQNKSHIPTAKSVIFLYMAGGMTHIDTFDPKPENKDVMGETPRSTPALMVFNWAIGCQRPPNRCTEPV